MAEKYYEHLDATTWLFGMFMRILRLLADRKICLEKSDDSYQGVSYGSSSHQDAFQVNMAIGGTRLSKRFGDYTLHAHLHMCVSWSTGDKLLADDDYMLEFTVREKSGAGVLLTGVSPDNWWPDTDGAPEGGGDPVLDALWEKIPMGKSRVSLDDENLSLIDEQALELIASWVAYLQNLEKAKS